MFRKSIHAVESDLVAKFYSLGPVGKAERSPKACLIPVCAGKRGPAETGILRRIHFTYERATRKFKADLDLWMGWIDYCKQSNSSRQMSKVQLNAA